MSSDFDKGPFGGLVMPPIALPETTTPVDLSSGETEADRQRLQEDSLFGATIEGALALNATTARESLDLVLDPTIERFKEDLRNINIESMPELARSMAREIIENFKKENPGAKNLDFAAVESAIVKALEEILTILIDRYVGLNRLLFGIFDTKQEDEEFYKILAQHLQIPELKLGDIMSVIITLIMNFIKKVLGRWTI